MSALLAFLHKHGLEALSSLAIKISQHPEFPTLFGLVYDQIDSPKLDPVVAECRGAIVEQVGDRWRFVARPFDRFFNVGEPGCAITAGEISSCSVVEKLDGTLIIAYFYADRWHFGTRGRPAADGECSAVFGEGSRPWRGTFAQLADLAAPDLRERMLYYASPAATYLFELTAPENRVVIPYEHRALTLLAARWNKTGRHLTSIFRWAGVKTHPAGDLEALTARVNAARAIDSEGVVVVSADGQRRAKLKNTAYVALHHAADSIGSTRSLVELVRSGEAAEVEAHFPHIKDALDRIRAQWLRWTVEASVACDGVAADAGDRPANGGRGDALFAQWIKSAAQCVNARRATWMPVTDSYVFAALRADPDPGPEAFLRTAPIDTVIKALALKETKS